MKKAKAELNQAALLRKARRILKMTNAELAAALGKSESGLLAWLAPRSAAKHRKMPQGSRFLLAAILKQHRAK